MALQHSGLVLMQKIIEHKISELLDLHLLSIICSTSMAFAASAISTVTVTLRI